MAKSLFDEIKDRLPFEQVLLMAIKVPGVRIKRDEFLNKELSKYCNEGQVLSAVKYNPARAGVLKDVVNKISLDAIASETRKVVGVSVAASIPSSAAAPIAISAASADIVSFFAFVLRAVQKLAYLYGFKEFGMEDEDVDSDTMDLMLVFLGVMFGVHGASAALDKLAQVMAGQDTKEMGKEALTKTLVYPIIKEIAAKVGVQMSRQVFADTVASAVPIVGAALSGGLTFMMYRPCCMRLRRNLMSYKLCDPVYYAEKGEDIEDLEYVEVVEETEE